LALLLLLLPPPLLVPLLVWRRALPLLPPLPVFEGVAGSEGRLVL